MKITSSAFQEGEFIPKKYTCDGSNVSPPLSWTEVPPKIMTFALISDDPDAPRGTWVHWVIFNIPSSVSEFPENILKTRTTSNGAKQGVNDSRSIGYDGPCPPSGVHRYFFKFYALDGELALEPGCTKSDLEKAMEGHVLAQAQVMGRYKRS